jgi:hypothetical protein
MPRIPFLYSYFFLLQRTYPLAQLSLELGNALQYVGGDRLFRFYETHSFPQARAWGSEGRLEIVRAVNARRYDRTAFGDTLEKDLQLP